MAATRKVEGGWGGGGGRGRLHLRPRPSMPNAACDSPESVCLAHELGLEAGRGIASGGCHHFGHAFILHPV